MKHLTAIEIVDLLDGRLDTARAAHIEDCAMCRAQADQLRATLDAAVFDVPEPSPLYWDHFSAQVRDRIGAENIERAGFLGWFGAWPRTALATCAALVLLTVVGVSVMRRSDPTSAGQTAPSTTVDALFVDDLAADEAWAEVRKAAESIGWDEVDQAGITAPGTAERAIGELSDRERRELISLLEAEMKRSGA